VAVSGPAEEQVFNPRADHRAVWVHRSSTDAANPRALLAALKEIRFPLGEGFIWIAAEANVARAVRDHVINVRCHPVQWLRASGYWVEGRADAYERLDS
jgi:NADPH-dependent ferric siderophore reductase